MSIAALLPCQRNEPELMVTGERTEMAYNAFNPSTEYVNFMRVGVEVTYYIFYGIFFLSFSFFLFFPSLPLPPTPCSLLHPNGKARASNLKGFGPHIGLVSFLS